ncbi:unnamed protein product [Closterium sp. NIES-65]|nr:unnamed protein product [Closterium sp. NIES-65]
MATNLVIAAGSSALATALDTMPQWGPYLSAWLASLSSTSLRPGLFLFALGGGYLGLNSLNDPSVNPATTSASSRAVSAPVSLVKLFSNGELDRPVDDGFSASDGFPSGVMGLGGAAVSLHGVVNFNFVVAMAALLSASGLCCAALLTHGLGGRMRYRHLAWMFWQPFVGGLRFVLMQAMAWTLFSFSLLIFSSVAVVAAFVGHTTLGGGGSVQGSVGGEAWRAVAVRPAQWTERELFVATRSAREVAGAAVRGVVQCVMRGMMGGLEGGVVRKTNEAAMEIVEDVSEAVTGCAVGRVEGGDRREGLVLLGACDSATSSTCDEFSLSVCEVLCAALLTAMAWAFAYCVICPGGYERSGRGERKWVQRIVMPLLEEAAAAYFHGISIVKEGAWRAAHGTWENRWKHQEHDKQEEEEGCKEKGHRLESGEGCVEGKGSDVTAASPPRPLIFTYHPHGLMPAVMAWFPLSSAFRALFPATRPVPLVASVCFRIPLARTYCLWGGVREVSRQGFLTALKDTGAAVLCPGGQSELTYHATNQSSCIALCARKIGFVRIAVQSNALLVPTLSFGEPHSFDNLFHWPSLQRFTYRRFGFPIPFWPVGLFGCLPLPRDRPMALVMGRPFDPRSLIPTINSEDPSYEDLCMIRDYYYAEVKALFDRHKAIHGFPHLTLELRK